MNFFTSVTTSIKKLLLDDEDPKIEEPHTKMFSLLPWEDELAKKLSEGQQTELKEKILSLSKDKQTFLVNAPVDFSFSWEKDGHLCTKLVELDEVLKTRRWDLVPKYIAEDKFWRNYLYNVQRSKQEFIAKILTEKPSTTKSEAKAPTSRELIAKFVEENPLEEVLEEQPAQEADLLGQKSETEDKEEDLKTFRTQTTDLFVSDELDYKGD